MPNEEAFQISGPPTSGSTSISVDGEDNFSLSSDVARQFLQEKSDLSKMMMMITQNQVYTEYLDKLIAKVDAAIEQNRNRQSFLKNRLALSKELAGNLSRSQAGGANIAVWTPYFKDSNGMVPSQNREAIEISQICSVDPLMEEDKKWKDKELEMLTDAVCGSLKDHQIIGLESRKEVISQKLRAAGIETSDERMQGWRDDVIRIKRRIIFIRERPNEAILGEAGGDYSHVDWAKISAIDFKGTRSIAQLRQKWSNDICPEFNQTNWSKEEDDRLWELSLDYGDWNTIAHVLSTNRSPFRCFERHIYLQQCVKEPKVWTPDEDQKLKQLVQLHRVGDEIPWAKISMYLEGRSKLSCEYRYTRSLNEKLRHGRWTEAEDMLLLTAVNKYGPQNWHKISECVQGRSALQCRDRWIHVLDHKRRDLPWSWEEHQRLLYGIRLFGREECAKIAKLIPGRNNMDVRMRIRLFLKYKIQKEEKPNKKAVFRHFANNYIFWKLRRKNVIEQFTKYLEDEQGNHRNQLASRLGLGSFVAVPEHGVALDYSSVRKERSEEFGHWKILGSGRWVKVHKKNPNEYDREDLMNELNKLDEQTFQEAVEWIRESDKRLEQEREQENDIPEDPKEANEFYERMYPQERLDELFRQVDELLPPKESDYNYYHQYKTRPPKIRIKSARPPKTKKVKNAKKKGNRRKPKGVRLLQQFEKDGEVDLNGLKWSDRMMLEINANLKEKSPNEQREFLIRSLCFAVRIRVHQSNIALYKSKRGTEDDEWLKAMCEYVTQRCDDPPAPIPIRPEVAEVVQPQVKNEVIPPNWREMSVKELMQRNISLATVTTLLQQAQSNPENDSSVEETQHGAVPVHRRRPSPRLAETEIKERAFSPDCQRILRKLLPPCLATANAVELFKLKIRDQLVKNSLEPDDTPAPSGSGSGGESEIIGSASDTAYRRFQLPVAVQQSADYALLKKRIYRLFFLPMMMQKAIEENGRHAK